MTSDDFDGVERLDTTVTGTTASEDDLTAPDKVVRLDANTRSAYVWVHGPVLGARSGDFIWVTEQQAHDYKGYVTRVHVVQA